MVSDTGIGLTPEDARNIFTPFEQVESDKNRNYQGTGLGLPLSRRLVKLHKGWIWAESEGPGKGCRFYIVIPAEGPQRTSIKGNHGNNEKENDRQLKAG
jgi:hypothetical protein